MINKIILFEWAFHVGWRYDRIALRIEGFRDYTFKNLRFREIINRQEKLTAEYQEEILMKNSERIMKEEKCAL